MITRDMIQGFIDGLKASGNDLSKLKQDVTKWLKSHKDYPSDKDTIDKIVSDLGSYRK